MENLYNTIYTTSINKNINSYKLNLEDNSTLLSIYRIYNHYIENEEHLKYIVGDNYKEIVLKMKIVLSDLQYRYSNVFCDYKEVYLTRERKSKLAPEVSDIIITSDQLEYDINLNDLISTYIDNSNSSYKYMKISPNDYYGEYRIENGGNILVNNISIDLEGNIDLKAIRDIDIPQGEVSFKFTIKNKLGIESNEALFTVKFITMANLPGNIEDINIPGQNREVRPLTVDYFDNKFTDPENDELHSIRIDYIPSANNGEYIYNSLPIYEGLIIDRVDLEAGLLVYEAPDTDDANLDFFEFSARDSGSLIWVN